MVRDFKYSITTKVKSICITVLLTFSCVVLGVIGISSKMPLVGMLGILLGLVGTRYEKYSHRKSKITIDDEKIHLYRFRAGLIYDITIRFSDIVAIKTGSTSKVYEMFVKKILIVSKYKKMDLDINCYDDYKEILEILIEKVNDNDKILIDDKIQYI